MQKKIILSVIIPIKNREDTLHRCINSIVTQNIDKMEIICVDDFSKDSSINIIKSYMEKDKRIKLIDRKNISTSNNKTEQSDIASARNIGLNSASGEFIAFLDADDWLEENAYQNALKYIKDDIYIVIFSANIIDEKSILSKEDYEYTLKYYNPDIENKIELTSSSLTKVSTSLWNKIFKKSIIDNYNICFSESMIFEDYEFVYKYIAHCRNIYFIKERYYNYVQHEHSIMGEVRNKKIIPKFYSLLAFYNIYKHYEQYSLLEKYKEPLQSMLLKSYNDDLYFFVNSEKLQKDYTNFVTKFFEKLNKDIIKNSLLLPNKNNNL